MCWHNGEIVDNLLLHCDVPYELWSFVFSMFGLQWVMLKSVVGLLFGWRNLFGKISFFLESRHSILVVVTVEREESLYI
jgi:hypothetical protein